MMVHLVGDLMSQLACAISKAYSYDLVSERLLQDQVHKDIKSCKKH